MRHSISSDIPRPSLHLVRHSISCSVIPRPSLHLVRHSVSGSDIPRPSLHLVRHSVSGSYIPRPTVVYTLLGTLLVVVLFLDLACTL